MLGHDFTAFYAAGHFAASGQFDKLYDIEAVKQFEQATGRQAHLSLGDAYGPYWNPPFYAWIFAPLAHLPYNTALLLWTLANVACGFAATVLLVRFLRHPTVTWRTWALIPLLLATSMPVIQALSHGQNTCTSLLLLTATVTFWRNGRGLAAGLVAGLLFYKPQLGAIVAASLVLDLGLPALLGLSVTGVALLLATVTTMPGTLTNFLHQLPINVRFMQVEHPYVWERHATIKAFWRLLFQGRDAGAPTLIVSTLTLLCCTALALALLSLIAHRHRLRFRTNPASSRDALISATICTMPLLMPFYFDYDLMLLAIPATLYASHRLRTADHHDRWLPRAWVALYLWLLINPGLAAHTHVNLTVPLLTAVAALHIRQAFSLVTTTATPTLHLPSTAPASSLATAA